MAQAYTPYDESGTPGTPVFTEYFMGGAYEVADSAVKKYYAIAGMTVAMQDGSGLQYLLTDHLGSIVAVTDASGTLTSQQRYLPFGEVRSDVGSIAETDLAYTGQRAVDSLGLLDYHARMYDTHLMRWVQPDSILPNPANPQSLNRYSYVLNAPIIFTDPTGYMETGACGVNGEECGGIVASPIVPASYPGAGNDDDIIHGHRGVGRRDADGGSSLDFTGYSDAEKQTLQSLYDNGGPDAQHGVEFILSHGIHVEIGTGWQSGFGSRGAWFNELANTLTVNYDSLGNFNSDNSRTLSGLSPWGYSLIIHEALHLEQGGVLAHSWEGERLAWQAGLRVQVTLEISNGNTSFALRGRDANAMKASDPVAFGINMLRDDPKYAVPMIIMYPVFPCIGPEGHLFCY